MKTYLDCYPCFMRQALEAARMAGADEDQQRVVLNHVLDALKQLDLSSTPPEMGDKIHRLVREVTGSEDPYRAVKENSTRQALALYPRLRALVSEAPDPLDRAVRLAIAGNIIDLGPAGEYDLWATIERVMAQPFAIDDSAAFRDMLIKTEWVLYLADNAGETVFDRVLIETIGQPVVYAAKGGPILNDATVNDTLAAGLDEVAEVISTGSDAPGTILDRCTEDFRRLYDQAELIIAKGQANYETLSTERKNIFFLLQTKCPVIARDVGVPTGSIVLKRGEMN
ncbi:MAG: DUF89 family protein [Anaerolineae bacterium]|nr:DUF89 family protein [Anaerolineae bacterium]